MSLINQMLRNLDERRAAHGATNLPDAVRSLPAPKKSVLPMVFGFGVLLFLLMGAVFYAFSGDYFVKAQTTPVVAPVISAPVAAPATPSPMQNKNPLPATVEPAIADVSGAKIEGLIEQGDVDTSKAGADETAAKEIAAKEIAAKEIAAKEIAAKEIAAKETAAKEKQLAEAKQIHAQLIEKSAKNKGLEGSPVIKEPAQAEQKMSQKSFNKREEADVELFPIQAKQTQAKNEPLVREVEKPSLAPTIKKTDSASSPSERADLAYRKAINTANQGRVDEAIDVLQNLLQATPTHLAARQLMLNLLLEAKRHDEALQTLQDGVQLMPMQVTWVMGLARLQLDRGQAEIAAQTLENGLPSAGKNAAYYGFAGHVQQRLNQQVLAAKYFQRAAELAPGDGRWWLGLGLALEAEGASTQAKEAFLRAKQTDNLNSALVSLLEQKLR